MEKCCPKLGRLPKPSAKTTYSTNEPYSAPHITNILNELITQFDDVVTYNSLIAYNLNTKQIKSKLLNQWDCQVEIEETKLSL